MRRRGSADRSNSIRHRCGVCIARRCLLGWFLGRVRSSAPAGVLFTPVSLLLGRTPLQELFRREWSAPSASRWWRHVAGSWLVCPDRDSSPGGEVPGEGQDDVRRKGCCLPLYWLVRLKRKRWRRKKKDEEKEGRGEGSVRFAFKSKADHFVFWGVGGAGVFSGASPDCLAPTGTARLRRAPIKSVPERSGQSLERLVAGSPQPKQRANRHRPLQTRRHDSQRPDLTRPIDPAVDAGG